MYKTAAYTRILDNLPLTKDPGNRQILTLFTMTEQPAKRQKWLEAVQKAVSSIWPLPSNTTTPIARDTLNGQPEASATPLQPTGSPHKRARTPSVVESNSDPCTKATYQMFQEQHQVSLSLKKFTGICAYLSAILRLGFRLNSRDMDSFIWQYPEFEEQLEVLVRHQIEQDTPSLPSYHHWFTPHLPRPHAGAEILTESKLWDIQREHPHIFLHAEMSLDYLSRQRIFYTT